MEVHAIQSFAGWVAFCDLAPPCHPASVREEREEREVRLFAVNLSREFLRGIYLKMKRTRTSCTAEGRVARHQADPGGLAAGNDVQLPRRGIVGAGIIFAATTNNEKTACAGKQSQSAAHSGDHPNWPVNNDIVEAVVNFRPGSADWL